MQKQTSAPKDTQYIEYLRDNLDRSITYAEYLANHLSVLIGYTEYLRTFLMADNVLPYSEFKEEEEARLALKAEGVISKYEGVKLSQESDEPVEDMVIDNSGDFTITSSGTRFNFVDPDPKTVSLEDIAYALSNTNRWGGHHRQQVSVAQHSICVARILAEGGHDHATQLQGLMHDSAEAYVGDICRPIKKKLKAFYEIEDRVMTTIAEALKFNWPMDEAVKAADNAALLYEWEYWEKGEDLPDTMSPETARVMFIAEYNRLIFALGL